LGETRMEERLPAERETVEMQMKTTRRREGGKED
jgi:hypothetical protein